MEGALNACDELCEFNKNRKFNVKILCVEWKCNIVNAICGGGAVE